MHIIKSSLHKSDFCACHIDLPHIQLLVVLNALVYLIRFEAFGCAAIDDISDFNGITRTG